MISGMIVTTLRKQELVFYDPVPIHYALRNHLLRQQQAGDTKSGRTLFQVERLFGEMK
jgi:hypothetical protein